jgi:2-dehydropantoate 2-reductase
LKKIKLKIAFIGAGSIGSLFGAYIANIKSGIYFPEIVFFCRRDHANAINKYGLKVQKDNSIYEIKAIKAYENKDFIEMESVENSFYSPDFLFLTVKAYDLESIMKLYKNLIDSARRIIILQNGIGNEDIVEKYCSKTKIIRMITSNGALLSEPGKVIHTGFGMTKIGFPFINDKKIDKHELENVNLDLQILKDILDSADLRTIISNDIIKDCWEKVLINIGINPIGALTRLTNGELLKSDKLKNLMSEAVKEALIIAKLKKVDLVDEDYVNLMYQVAFNTSQNKNSMLQDILRGKLTEIDFMNGKIVNYAKELDIKVPINEILTSLIKGLESSQI